MKLFVMLLIYLSIKPKYLFTTLQHGQIQIIGILLLKKIRPLKNSSCVLVKIT